MQSKLTIALWSTVLREAICFEKKIFKCKYQSAFLISNFGIVTFNCFVNSSSFFCLDCKCKQRSLLENNIFFSFFYSNKGIG